MMKQLKQLKRN